MKKLLILLIFSLFLVSCTSKNTKVINMVIDNEQEHLETYVKIRNFQTLEERNVYIDSLMDDYLEEAIKVEVLIEDRNNFLIDLDSSDIKIKKYIETIREYKNERKK